MISAREGLRPDCKVLWAQGYFPSTIMSSLSSRRDAGIAWGLILGMRGMEGRFRIFIFPFSISSRALFPSYS